MSLYEAGAQVGENCLVLFPVAGLQEVFVEPFFRRSGLGLPVVAPGGVRRQRHQDRLGAPARLQAEERPTVVDQVELDIPPAAVELEVPFTLSVRGVLASLEEREVRRNKGVA